MDLGDRMETQEEIFTHLRRVIEDLLKVSQDRNSLQLPEITLETDLFDDLGLDSVEMLDLATAISEEFNVNPDIMKSFDVKKVDDIVRYIAKIKCKN